MDLMRKSIHSPPYLLLRERLKAGRVSAGLTQTELSLKLRRPQSYVAKYEGGDRRLDIIEFLDVCAILGIDLNALIVDLQSHFETWR